MNQKLQAKDLINIGLFTVLYFVLGCCVAIPIGFVPIFLPILGALWTLITGIPFMLFAVRVKKFGMVTIMVILSGILMGLTGMGFWGVPMGVVRGAGTDHPRADQAKQQAVQADLHAGICGLCTGVRVCRQRRTGLLAGVLAASGDSVGDEPDRPLSGGRLVGGPHQGVDDPRH